MLDELAFMIFRCYYLCSFHVSFFWFLNHISFVQAFSGLDSAISRQAKMLGNTALDAALNAQFLVQIGVFTAVPMIMGFILELGLIKVSVSSTCVLFYFMSLPPVESYRAYDSTNVLFILR